MLVHLNGHGQSSIATVRDLDQLYGANVDNVDMILTEGEDSDRKWSRKAYKMVTQAIHK